MEVINRAIMEKIIEEMVKDAELGFTDCPDMCPKCKCGDG